MRRWPAALVAIVLVSALAACAGDDDTAVALDGSPRYPDDEGVATALSRERITLDGDRTYDVSDDLVSFSTYNRQIEPMRRRLNQYVQVGLDGRTVVWMAGIAGVVPTDPAAVYYQGILERVRGVRAEFADGTVLRLASGVRSPVAHGRVQARIDPARRAVVELRVL